MIDPLEMLSEEECFRSIGRERLLGQLARLIENHPFYGEKLKTAGFDGRRIIDLGRFEEIPVTTKDEILAEQERHPPFGRIPEDCRENALRRVHITSGTTGRPFFIVMTEKDIAATVEAGRRAFLCAGLRPEDTVIHCLNYCLWAGGVTDHLNLEATGATVIPFGVGNSRQLIQIIRQLKPTAISCTPSYLIRLEYLLESEFGLSPASLGLKKAFLGGEGGLHVGGLRDKIERVWNLRAIDANYGMADVLSIFGSECSERTGLHFHGQGILHLELIDPVLGERIPLETGRKGEMVLTTLVREAQPLLRYRTRDLIEIGGTQPCGCGRRSFRFRVIGRADDMFVVRGINVFPGAIDSVLAEHPQAFSGEYEIILTEPPPYERPLLRIEIAKQYQAKDTEGLADLFLKMCKERLNFSPELQLLEYGQFPRTEGKAKRIKRRTSVHDRSDQ